MASDSYMNDVGLRRMGICYDACDMRSASAEGKRTLRSHKRAGATRNQTEVRKCQKRDTGRCILSDPTDSEAAHPTDSESAHIIPLFWNSPRTAGFRHRQRVKKAKAKSKKAISALGNAAEPMGKRVKWYVEAGVCCTVHSQQDVSTRQTLRDKHI